MPIETKRLLLRPFRPEDAPAMYDGWASDPVVTHFLTWPTHESVDATRQVIDFWLATEDPTWCIALKETGVPVGSISVVRAEGDTAEVGYCIARAYWGQGIVPEAFGALIDALFDTFGAKEITAKHDTENPNSGRVMQKCGLRFVEIRERYAENNLGLRDMAMYSLKKEDL